MSELILAFDYGLARIGIATGNTLTRTATPLVAVAARDGVPSWADIDRIISDWRPAALVVGLPGNPSNPIRARVEGFVQELRKRYKLATHTVDEALTSRAAESDLKARRQAGGRKASKPLVDMNAACLIAEQWMTE